MIEFSKWMEATNGSQILANFNQTKKQYGVLGAEELVNISKATEIVASDPKNSSLVKTWIRKLADKVKESDPQLSATLQMNLQRLIGGAINSANMERKRAAQQELATGTADSTAKVG